MTESHREHGNQFINLCLRWLLTVLAILAVLFVFRIAGAASEVILAQIVIIKIVLIFAKDLPAAAHWYRPLRPSFPLRRAAGLFATATRSRIRSEVAVGAFA